MSLSNSSQNNQNLYKKRLNFFQKEIQKQALDLFVIENPIDIAYLTGMKLSKGELFIHQKEVILFVDGRYLEEGRKKAACAIAFLDEKENWLLKQGNKKVAVVGFDAEKGSYHQFIALKKFLLKIGRQLPQKPKVCPTKSPTQNMRLIKDKQELKSLEESAALLSKGFQWMQTQIKEGITEWELVVAFEHYCKLHGADRLAFDPIIAFGSNSAMPHYHSGTRRLQQGDVILIDIGVVVDGYCSDMSRVIFFGEVSPKIKEIFSVVKKAHQKALEFCRPGVSLSHVDQAARKVIKKAGYERNFPHSLGHGIGLEIHEPPLIKGSSSQKDCTLEPRMVLTIEPGIYIPRIGGVRYEDMIVITETGYRNLYQEFIP